MMGWFAAGAITALTLAAILLFVPQRKQLWPVVAAAAVLGLAGYAWQGQPDQPMAAAKPLASEMKAAASLIDMRAAMDKNYGISRQWLVTADSFARDGRYEYSAAFIQAGLKKYPENGDLWAGLGVVLLLAGDNQMSPPAKMAFANARKYAPLNRAPDYIDGLVELFEGRPLNTINIWQKLIDGAPDNAIWKPKVESQLAGLINVLQSAQSANAK
jgi:cytochrome c-type biogenesis protein CcmH